MVRHYIPEKVIDIPEHLRNEDMEHIKDMTNLNEALPVVTVRDQQYLEDAKGKLIPLEQVSDDLRLRDGLVLSLIHI